VSAADRPVAAATGPTDTELVAASVASLLRDRGDRRPTAE